MNGLTELLESAGIKNNYVCDLHVRDSHKHDGSYQPHTIIGADIKNNNLYDHGDVDTYFPKPEDYYDPSSPFYGMGNGGDDQPPPSPPGIAIMIDTEPMPVPEKGIKLGWKEITK